MPVDSAGLSGYNDSKDRWLNIVVIEMTDELLEHDDKDELYLLRAHCCRWNWLLMRKQ